VGPTGDLGIEVVIESSTCVFCGGGHGDAGDPSSLCYRMYESLFL